MERRERREVLRKSTPVERTYSSERRKTTNPSRSRSRYARKGNTETANNLLINQLIVSAFLILIFLFLGVVDTGFAISFRDKMKTTLSFNITLDDTKEMFSNVKDSVFSVGSGLMGVFNKDEDKTTQNPKDESNGLDETELSDQVGNDDVVIDQDVIKRIEAETGKNY